MITTILLLLFCWAPPFTHSDDIRNNKRPKQNAKKKHEQKNETQNDVNIYDDRNRKRNKTPNS